MKKKHHKKENTRHKKVEAKRLNPNLAEFW
jgi:hypothetical protein